MTKVICEIEDCVWNINSICDSSAITLLKYDGDYQIHYCNDHVTKGVI